MKLNKIKLWKFNILDLMIILIVIIFVGVFTSTKLQANRDEVIETGSSNVGSKFTYTISIEGLSATSIDMFKVGDEVYDKISSTSIGKIAELNIAEAQGLLEKDNGEVIVTRVPGKIDVDLVIETDGAIRNGEYLANGLIRIMVGNYREIKTKYLMCAGTITSIDR